MSITIAIGNDPTDIKNLDNLNKILDSQEDNPEISELKIWISDMRKILTDPSAFANT